MLFNIDSILSTFVIHSCTVFYSSLDKKQKSFLHNLPTVYYDSVQISASVGRMCSKWFCCFAE